MRRKWDSMKKNAKTNKQAAETAKNETHMGTAGAATTAAILGLAVIFTPPPEWKQARKEGPTPYWQVEIKDAQGKRYSDVYRVKDPDNALTLAHQMAKDRKIPLTVREPAPAKKPSTDPAPAGETTPF